MEELNAEDEEKMKEIISNAEKLMNEFWNRTIYKELSIETLASVSNEKIEQVILDYIDTKVSDYYLKFDIVSNMSEGFQMVESTLALESQVNNGGFNQFFYNPSGQYAEMALHSLKLIDADEYHEILEGAIATYVKERENPELQSLYSQRTLEGFSKSYKLTALNKFDEKFYALGDQLTELRLKFIRSNLYLFVGS